MDEALQNFSNNRAGCMPRLSRLPRPAIRFICTKACVP